MKTMKKIAYLSFVCLFLFGLTGCGKENVQLDLTKAKEKIANLKSEKFSRASATEAMVSLGVFGEELTDVYDLSLVGITSSNIYEQDGMTEYSMAITQEDKAGYAYFVGKAKSGKKNDLKKELNEYFKEAEEAGTLLAKEVDEYLVYIVSKDNESAYSAFEENRYQPLFSMMMDVDDSLLESMLGISSTDVEEYAIETPMAIISAQSYMIMKPAKGKKEVVKKAIDSYMERQEEQWSTYLADQYELVRNRKETELGDYLIVIISEDNDAVLNAIKKAQIK